MNINKNIINELSYSIKINEKYITSVLNMLSEDKTIPFIARYRKEETNAMNEEQIRIISKTYNSLLTLEKRKDDVIRLITEKGKISDEIINEVNSCIKLSEVEDIYRPYKEKKKTRATEAKKHGLDPFAKFIMSFPIDKSIETEAKKYINNDIITDSSLAINGALDIIAENINDDVKIRKWIKSNLINNGKFKSLVKKNAVDERGTFKNYYEYEEYISSIKPHRVLALNRGEKLKILKISIIEDLDRIHNYISRQIIKNEKSSSTSYVKDAIRDSYKRLIKPSIEREIRSENTFIADDYSINIFSKNLKSLFLQAPIKNKVILGVDPAFRTGCKLAVVDKNGKLKEITVVYPNQKVKGEKIPQERIRIAKEKIKLLIDKYKVDIITVGNGTASRETEKFISDFLNENSYNISYAIVSEAGASVYSASKLAKEEFPTLEVEERSAVSIARRIQDPLSELIKIDPKSIGVGQYQHDVDQKKLSESLDFVVESAVNSVGVDINTASSSLLQYVSGLNKTIANNIVDYRENTQLFKSRKELLKVPKLGKKAFELSAGFLRINDSSNILDSTGIHPESYVDTKNILKTIQSSLNEVGTMELKDKIKNVNKQNIIDSLEVGPHTLNDILDALIAPNRDPRDEYDTPILKKDILSLDDISIGTELQGTVRNVVAFGAFIDCGIKEDGLVHKSKMSNRFIKDPLEIVSVGDIVKVWVIDIDKQRKRLQLTLIDPKIKEH